MINIEEEGSPPSLCWTDVLGILRVNVKAKKVSLHMGDCETDTKHNLVEIAAMHSSSSCQLHDS
jgi:hypothetical protein